MMSPADRPSSPIDPREIGSSTRVMNNLSPTADRPADRPYTVSYVRPSATIALPRPTAATSRGRTRRGLALWAALFALLCGGLASVYWFMLPPSVSVVVPRRGPAVQAVYATGTVEPSVMVPISARSAARLV